MSTVQRIAKNTTLLLVSRLINVVLASFFIIYTARYLGAEGYGILSFALAFVTIFSILMDFGLSKLTVREVAKDRSLAGKYMGNTVIMKLILIAATFGLIAITINLLGYPEQTITLVYLIGLSVGLDSFSVIFYSIFEAYEKMENESLGRIIRDAILLVGTLFAVSQGFNVVGFGFAYLFAGLITLGYNFAICTLRIAKLKVEIDWEFWKSTSKEAFSFGLTGFFVTIYYWVDSVVLSIMKGDLIVGWYGAAFRLITILLFIPAILNVSIFPVMSRFYVSSEDHLRFAYERYFKYMTVLGLPIGVGVTLLADRIIQLIFGIEYMSSIIALQILVWSGVFIFMGGAFGRLLESSNRQKTIAKITGCSMVLNVILNLILIPGFSYIGTSVTKIITELTVLILLATVCSSIGYGLSKNNLVNLMKAIIATLPMIVVLVFLKDLNLILLILLAAVVYLLALFLLRVIDNEDLRIFRTILRKGGDQT
ncbi:MAG: flippase [Promethearchaeota archaeon]